MRIVASQQVDVVIAEQRLEEKLSSVDTAWYRMESSSNSANIGAVLMFDRQLDFQRLREVVAERLVERFPRFRQRVVESPGRLGRPSWEEDPDFSIDNHLDHLRLAPPGDRRALERIAGRLMTRALDMEQPLWQIHQIDNFEGRSVLLAQIHHCMGDGFALARVLLSIADGGGLGEASVADEPGGSGNHRSIGGWLRKGLAKFFAEEEGGRKLLGQIGRVAAEIGHILMMRFDRKTVLKRPMSGRLRVAWTETYSLEELKEIARALDYTLNDVLMAGVTGAIREYLVEHGDRVDDLEMRAIVPVNLRPVGSIEEMPPALGNEFGLVFLELPVRHAEIGQRLAALKASIEELKRSPEAGVVFALLNAEGRLSALVEKVINGVFARKGSLVVSNMPGPREKLRIAGGELEDLMFWVPHPGPTVGLGISLISYAGKVSIGVRADAGVVENPRRLVERLEGAFAELKAEAVR